MKKLILIVFFFGLFFTSHSQISSEKLQKLDQYIEQARQQWKVPGLGVTIVKDGKVIHAKGYGLRELGTDKEADTQTLFAICSTTKAMVAAGIGLLVDKGELQWDDRVIDHLPEFRLADPQLTHEIRVRDLLTHNTGIGNTDFLWMRGLPKEEVLQRMQFAEPTYSLRFGFVYQNVMYAFAGRLIEKVSGMAWEDYMKEQLFEPLGMHRTFALQAQTEGQDNKSVPHHFVNGTIQPIEDFSVDNAAPAGAIWSCSDDMGKWMQFMLDSARVDGKRLLRAKTYVELLRPQTLFPGSDFYPALHLKNPHVTTYALGWFQYDHDGRFVHFHTGSLDGTIAIIGLIPDEKLGVYIWGNLDHAELRHALMYKVFDVFGPGSSDRDYSTEALKLYTALREKGKVKAKTEKAKRVEGTQTSYSLEAYTGIYEHKLLGKLKVLKKGDQLVVDLGPKFTITADHWHFDTFSGQWNLPWWDGAIWINFQLNTSGKISGLEMLGYTFKKR